MIAADGQVAGQGTAALSVSRPRRSARRSPGMAGVVTPDARRSRRLSRSPRHRRQSRHARLHRARAAVNAQARAGCLLDDAHRASARGFRPRAAGGRRACRGPARRSGSRRSPCRIGRRVWPGDPRWCQRTGLDRRSRRPEEHPAASRVAPAGTSGKYPQPSRRQRTLIEARAQRPPPLRHIVPQSARIGEMSSKASRTAPTRERHQCDGRTRRVRRQGG